jgi:hypothetical protein
MHRLAQDSIKEMERHRSLDAYIPSFHNTVTVACIQVDIDYILIIHLFILKLLP